MLATRKAKSFLFLFYGRSWWEIGKPLARPYKITYNIKQFLRNRKKLMPILGLGAILLGASLFLVKFVFGIQNIVLSLIIAICYLLAGLDGYGFAHYTSGGNLLQAVQDNCIQRKHLVINPNPPSLLGFLMWIIGWPVFSLIQFILPLNYLYIVARFEFIERIMMFLVFVSKKFGMNEKKLRKRLLDYGCSDGYIDNTLLKNT